MTKMNWRRTHDDQLLAQRIHEEQERGNYFNMGSHLVALYADQVCMRCKKQMFEGEYQYWVSKGRYWCGCEREVEMTTALLEHLQAEQEGEEMTEELPDFPSGVEVEWVLVGPTEAEKYLEHNTNNRKLHPRALITMVKDMKRGSFTITHQGIAFDEDGVLLDGQHRLEAIIQSGIHVWMLVTTGLPRASQHIMDVGAKRQTADFLPGTHASTRASALRLVLGAREIGPRLLPKPYHEGLRYLSVPQILEEVQPEDVELSQKLVLKARKAAARTSLAPGPLLASCILVFGHDVGMAEEFLDGIAAMTGLEAGDPRLALIKYRGQSGKPTQQAAATMLCCRAALAFRKGTKMTVLRQSWEIGVDLS